MRDQVREVICDVFQLDAATPPDKLTADDVQEWDSVLHLTLILALESRLGVPFAPEEVATLKSCDALSEAIEAQAS